MMGHCSVHGFCGMVLSCGSVMRAVHLGHPLDLYLAPACVSYRYLCQACAFRMARAEREALEDDDGESNVGERNVPEDANACLTCLMIWRHDHACRVYAPVYCGLGETSSRAAIPAEAELSLESVVLDGRDDPGRATGCRDADLDSPPVSGEVLFERFLAGDDRVVPELASRHRSEIDPRIEELGDLGRPSAAQRRLLLAALHMGRSELRRWFFARVARSPGDPGPHRQLDAIGVEGGEPAAGRGLEWVIDSVDGKYEDGSPSGAVRYLLALDDGQLARRLRGFRGATRELAQHLARHDPKRLCALAGPLCRDAERGGPREVAVAATWLREHGGSRAVESLAHARHTLDPVDRLHVLWALVEHDRSRWARECVAVAREVCAAQFREGQWGKESRYLRETVDRAGDEVLPWLVERFDDAHRRRSECTVDADNLRGIARALPGAAGWRFVSSVSHAYRPSVRAMAVTVMVERAIAEPSEWIRGETRTAVESGIDHCLEGLRTRDPIGRHPISWSFDTTGREFEIVEAWIDPLMLMVAAGLRIGGVDSKRLDRAETAILRESIRALDSLLSRVNPEREGRDLACERLVSHAARIGRLVTWRPALAEHGELQRAREAHARPLRRVNTTIQRYLQRRWPGLDAKWLRSTRREVLALLDDLSRIEAMLICWPDFELSDAIEAARSRIYAGLRAGQCRHADLVVEMPGDIPESHWWWRVDARRRS